MIVKLVFCVRRKPELTREEFQRYWLDEHGPLVRSLREAQPGLRRYVQSHTIEIPASELARASRGTAEPYDGITEVWIDDESLESEPTPEFIEAGMRLLDDESTFVDFANSSVFFTIEREIF
ncbi:MAG: EthD domain-containing protein [Acidimicrobiales bacterium]